MAELLQSSASDHRDSWLAALTQRRATRAFKEWMAYGQFRGYRMTYFIVSRTGRYIHALGGQEDWERFGLDGDLALIGALPQLARDSEVGLLHGSPEDPRQFVLPNDFMALRVRMLAPHRDATYGELAVGQELEVPHGVGVQWVSRGVAEPSVCQLLQRQAKPTARKALAKLRGKRPYRADPDWRSLLRELDQYIGKADFKITPKDMLDYLKEQARTKRLYAKFGKRLADVDPAGRQVTEKWLPDYYAWPDHAGEA